MQCLYIRERSKRIINLKASYKINHVSKKGLHELLWKCDNTVEKWIWLIWYELLNSPQTEIILDYFRSRKTLSHNSDDVGKGTVDIFANMLRFELEHCRTMLYVIWVDRWWIPDNLVLNGRHKYAQWIMRWWWKRSILPTGPWM